jgi:hypothetical protein
MKDKGKVSVRAKYFPVAKDASEGAA